MNRIVTRWLPPTRTLHPFPEVRFAARLPKARAQCGSPARWDLRGGPPARAVPTATQFCCFGSRRISWWQSSRPCSANARPQTARRWATRRRPESRELLRPVAARKKPQATAGRRRELQIEAARQSPLYLDPAHGRCRSRSSVPSSARTPGPEVGDRRGTGTGRVCWPRSTTR